MLHLKRDLLNIARLKKIILVFSQEGLGYYLGRTNLNKHLPLKRKLLLNKKLSKNEEIAVRLRHSFERLGPTFVKLGQLLSLRPDLVPKEFSQEFEKLQDRVPSFAYSTVEKTIQAELGAPIKKIFKSFNKKPIASASIAQVHLATLKSGKKVAVKVQRPNIEKTINSDLDILLHLAQSLEKHFKNIENYHPTKIVEEFARYTKREIDFVIEAQNANRLREELKHNKGVKIPKIYPKYSCKKILTMEYVDGFKFDDFKSIKKYKINKKKVALNSFYSILDQALFGGFFHADPHPANFLIQKNGKIVYLDFGIVGEISPAERRKVIKFFTTLPEKNAEKSFEIVLSFAKKINCEDMDKFKREAMSIMEDVYFNNSGKKSIGKAMYEILSLGAKNGITFDPNHFLLAKSVYQSEGLIMKLDPSFKVSTGINLFTKKYLKEEYSLPKVVERLKKEVLKGKDVLEDLPEHLNKIITNFEKEEQPQSFSQKQLEEVETKFENISKNRNETILISVVLILAVVMFYLEGRVDIFGIPLSTIFLIVGIILLFKLLLKKKN